MNGMNGMNVRYEYNEVHSAIQVVTTLKIVSWRPNKNTERPAKKRKSDAWSSSGPASIIQGTISFVVPCI
jgi:hypothetical protein